MHLSWCYCLTLCWQLATEILKNGTELVADSEAHLLSMLQYSLQETLTRSNFSPTCVVVHVVVWAVFAQSQLIRETCNESQGTMDVACPFYSWRLEMFSMVVMPAWHVFSVTGWTCRKCPFLAMWSMSFVEHISEVRWALGGQLSVVGYLFSVSAVKATMDFVCVSHVTGDASFV